MNHTSTNNSCMQFDSSNDVFSRQLNVPLDLCTAAMDSLSTAYRSPCNEHLKRIKQSPSYSVNSDQGISNLEYYSMYDNSPYSDEGARIDLSPYNIKSEECSTHIDFYSKDYKFSQIDNSETINQSSCNIKTEESIASMDSYTTNYKSFYSKNSVRFDQSPFIVKSEENCTNFNSYSESHKYLHSDSNSFLEESQYIHNSSPYDPSMDHSSSTSRHPQDLLGSVKSEFELNGNLDDFDSESDIIIDYEDSTWDLGEEIWEQFDFTNINLDLNIDDFALENTDRIDSQNKIKRRSISRKAKKKAMKSIQEINVSDDCIEVVIRKTPGADNRDRCPRSWEFLMRLLVNSGTNPSIIRWEDESQYIFRLVEADLIVQIWNSQSKKVSPNKDNFARSLRYHYKKGILISVPEKQLVYQCGPEAIKYLNNLRKNNELNHWPSSFL